MSTQPRATVNALPGYALAEQILSGVERVIQLGQNELGIEASPRAVEAVARTAGELTRYPDAQHLSLRQAIAEIHGLDAAKLLCGAGSMELMGLLATVYGEAGVEVVVSELGYKYFQVQCAVSGAELRVVPEPGMRADVKAIAAAVTQRTKLVFVVHPNNPTGAALEPGALQELRERLPSQVLLVVDGAYAEFASPSSYETGFDLVDNGDNVAVLRTFSKAYGLAALRVGWMYAGDDVVELLSRVHSPNSITTQALAAAEAAVGDRVHLEQVLRRVIALREQFIDSVRSLGLTALPSEGNFVLVRFADEAAAARIFAGLKQAGIIVRPMHSYGLHDHVRVTIGSEEEMNILERHLRRLV